MLSLWTGLYPNKHGNQYFAATTSFRVPTPHTKPRVPDHVTFLSERLQKHGYKTGAIVTNPWLKQEFGFGRGFDLYRYMTWKAFFARGEKVNRAARKLLEKWQDERFFLYVHYMDVHKPYPKEQPYQSEFPTVPHLPEETAELLAGYNAQIRVMDDFFRNLLDILEDLGLEEETLVVFTSDHGEEFREHNGIGHGHALYQELVHVPLLLRHPKLEPMAKRIDTPVSLVDIAPTILELTTGSVPDHSDGISLRQHIRGRSDAEEEQRILYSELGRVTAAVRGDKKVIRAHREGKTRQWAYDLTADPEEAQAVQSERGWIADLSRAIDEHVAKRFVDTKDRAPIDPATEERVRALGY
jgi:arylsulfatase A-like enzyme